MTDPTPKQPAQTGDKDIDVIISPKQPDWLDEVLIKYRNFWCSPLDGVLNTRDVKSAILTHISQVEAAADIAGRIDEALKEAEAALQVAESGEDQLMIKYLNSRIEQLTARQSAEGSE